ncbi:hypothetical protein ACNSZF_23380 [Burkholderia gladioli]
MSLYPQPSPGRSRIVVLNRWSDDFAAYHRYIDHAAHEVAYVCTPDGAAALAASRIAHLERLPDFLDEAALHEAVRACGAALGGIDRLVALSEFDLIAAGRLREAFDIPGDRPAAVARFRDKAVMKQVVAAAGLRVPRFVALDEVERARCAGARRAAFSAGPEAARRRGQRGRAACRYARAARGAVADAGACRPRVRGVHRRADLSR